MEFKTVTANLMTDDVNMTIEWYKSHLNAEVAGSVPSPKNPVILQWARIRFGGAELMFQLADSIAEEIPGVSLGNPNPNIFSLFIQTTGLMELYTQFKKAGVKPVCDWHTTFYGMNEFMIKDCNGYLLNFAEPVKK